MKGDQKLSAANQSKLPDRRVRCTHMTMKRVFDHDGTLTCPRCGSLPYFGWIYACTVDEHGCMDTESSPSGSMAPEALDSHLPAPNPTLSDWVTKAVGQGHYTDEQVGILLAQRADVMKTARSQISCGTDDSTILDKGSAEATLMEPKAPPCPASNWTAHSTSAQDIAAQEAPSATASKCRLMICHFCHPAACDRSWLSLNKFCSNTTKQEVPLNDIFDIPTSALSRIPLPSAQETTTHDAKIETYKSTEGLEVQTKEEPVSPEAPAGDEDSTGEDKGSILHRQRMHAFEARLRTAQHWSHMGLHESLARQNPQLQPGWKQDPPKRKANAGRPGLIRTPKWTANVKHRVQGSISQEAGP